MGGAEPDWSREVPARFWDPPRRLLRAIRAHQRAAARGGLAAAIARRRWTLSWRFWSAVTGADIPLNARLGGGLLLPHPNGVVIHPDAVVGPNCLILQQVTLGVTAGRDGAPVLGAGVDVGAGAKVLGPVRLGDGAVVGANAVVLADVPPGEVAVGVPARVIARRK